MTQISSFKTIRGLDLNSNLLVASPGKDFYGTGRAATQIADNCVLSRQRMIGNRRGFAYFTTSTTSLVDILFEYQSYLIEHQIDDTLWYADATSGNRTQYAITYKSPPGYDMNGAVGRGNFYFSTASGVMKLDKITNTPVSAGMTKGLDARATVGTTGFMPVSTQVGYHITWTRTDANNQVLTSDVSTKAIAKNVSTTVTGSVTLKFTVPADVQAADSYQIWRTVCKPIVDPDPGDECYLVSKVLNTNTLASLTWAANVVTATTFTAHGYVTGATLAISGSTISGYNGKPTITVTGTTTFTYPMIVALTTPATGTITYGYAPANVVTFVDTTDDTNLLAGLPLYTNATQEGALQGNARPPYCTTMTNYKDYQIYANTALDHQISMNCIAVLAMVSGTSKFIINNNGGAYTYTSTASESARAFQLFTASDPATNIALTVQSLVHAINVDTLNAPCYAEYTSGPNDNPGNFRIWTRSPASGPFWITANNTAMGNEFLPTVPVTGQTCASSNDARPNRIYYSKYEQPDHVPILNSIDVGRLDQPILRVLSVRDACYVIKADGIYYLSGLTAPFNMLELDSTCHCIAPATAVALNNQIYMLSNQGVVKVSTSGVTVISFDIEPQIMGVALPMSNLANVAFGVAHEADRHYILWLPSATGDTYATKAFVFHTFINEWTSMTKPAAAGIVLSSNYSLYISSGIENAVLKQRRAGDSTDYSDEEVPITITGQNGLEVSLTWTSIFPPTVGISLHQGGTVAKVLAVVGNASPYTMTIDRQTQYTLGAATSRLPIYAHIRMSPMTMGGEIGMSKQIYAVAFMLADEMTTQGTIEVATNEAPSLRSYYITRLVTAGYGMSQWGNVAWGDDVSPLKAVPWEVALPVPDITGEFITVGWIHAVSQEQFNISQVSFEYDPLTEFSVTA